MLNVIKLGHVEFTVRDLPRMSDFYKDVIGLVETGREVDAVHLSTVIDRSSVVLRQGDKTALAKIAFQVDPVSCNDIVAELDHAAFGQPNHSKHHSSPFLWAAATKCCR